MKRILVYCYLLVYNIVLGLYNFIVSFFWYKTVKVYMCNHFTIGMNKIIKSKVIFPHPVGIVIGEKVVLGNKCIIYQNVTLGIKNGKYPIIGNNVTIYPNSIIVGDVVIGNNAIIGANSVVLQNVNEDSVVVGNPAKEIK